MKGILKKTTKLLSLKDILRQSLLYKALKVEHDNCDHQKSKESMIIIRIVLD